MFTEKDECLRRITWFCKIRIKRGKCSEGDCEFCCINEAYKMIEEQDFKED